MAQLAIKGHATRGSEVIALLESLGGVNTYKVTGDITCVYYAISSNNEIYISEAARFSNTIYTYFTLEEFLEKFPYKVGDKVMTDDGDKANIVGMVWDNDIDDVFYETRICNEVFKYPKELLQPYKEETMEDKLDLLQQLKEYFENTLREVIEKEWHEYDKYNEISPKINEYLEYVNNIRQPKYPKTFIEVLNFWHPDRQLEDDYQRCYKKDLVEKLQDLLYARDAYWEIAGEQMGLGKPWEPDFGNENEYKYGLFRLRDIIYKDATCINPTLLIFPTEEMRDAFYENFKELIESCKELL